MYYTRKTRTASGATAIQVVEYVKRKLIVVRHIGSAHTKEEEEALLMRARAWIEEHDAQTTLFPSSVRGSPNPLDNYVYLGVRYAFIHDVLRKILTRFGFTSLGSRLLHDLVVIRIVEPASKLRSLALIEEYFGVSHRRQSFYEALPQFAQLKDAVERGAVARAKEEFGFDFSLVFYDVTTLYYESFEADELRKPGFSKDNKSQQPQIVLGLMVTGDGFPVSYEIFAGNTFEGHTIIPVIQAFKRRHGSTTLTVVADAAMISANNVKALEAAGLRYIVGARMGNLSPNLIKEISPSLMGHDQAIKRISTPLGDLVCQFSAKRYAKDKREMEKQIARAEQLMMHPGAVKRAKFLKMQGASIYGLHEELVEKTRLLLGIKGYYTNLTTEVSNETIVDRYHSLWHVEQAFRVAKSDLATRPIFHVTEDAIRVHMLICFMALAVSKYMEIKVGLSLQRIVAALRGVTEALLQDKVTGEQVVMRMDIPNETREILKKLGL